MAQSASSRFARRQLASAPAAARVGKVTVP